MSYRIVAAMLVTAGILVDAASAQSIRDQQERYCTGDAFRLCASEIPNEDRIEACMARLRHQLSPECRAVFDRTEPVAQGGSSPRAKARKPIQVAPQ